MERRRKEEEKGREAVMQHLPYNCYRKEEEKGREAVMQHLPYNC